MINEQTNNEVMSKLADTVSTENKKALSRKVTFDNSKTKAFLELVALVVVAYFFMSFAMTGVSSNFIFGAIASFWLASLLYEDTGVEVIETMPFTETRHINEVLFNGEVTSETTFNGLESCDVVSVVKTNIDELLGFCILGSSTRMTVSTTDGRQLDVYVSDNTVLKSGDELEVTTTVTVIKAPFTVVGTNQEVKLTK